MTGSDSSGTKVSKHILFVTMYIINHMQCHVSVNILHLDPRLSDLMEGLVRKGRIAALIIIVLVTFWAQ